MMTDTELRELDARLALAMGVALGSPCAGEIGELPISPDGWFCLACGASGGWGYTTHDVEPRRFSTDPAASAELRAFVGKKWDYQIHCSHEGFGVGIEVGPNGREVWVDDVETEVLAFALAADRALGVEGKG